LHRTDRSIANVADSIVNNEQNNTTLTVNRAQVSTTKRRTTLTQSAARSPIAFWWRGWRWLLAVTGKRGYLRWLAASPLAQVVAQCYKSASDGRRSRC